HGGALPATAAQSLLTRDLRPLEQQVVGVQTPQAFRAAPLLAAYRAADADGFEGTDTAATFERYAGLPVLAVPSPSTNLKVTWPEDLALAEGLLA
ncbi:MAG TPA: 2-C-methyl-D-erythritol 4-phosphate cytidylyltransferase, partial [Acidimicrobiales bacterium]